MTKPALVVDHLVLRTATEEAEIDHLRQALNRGHYLKAGRPAGHVLWQGISAYDRGGLPELVAVLCWGGAGQAPQGARQSHRLGLRHLRQPPQAHRATAPASTSSSTPAAPISPASASPSPCAPSAANLKPTTASSPFSSRASTIPEEHTGTLYKATNWTPLGFTKGYKRHRRDFYQDTGKPKTPSGSGP